MQVLYVTLVVKWDHKEHMQRLEMQSNVYFYNLLHVICTYKVCISLFVLPRHTERVLYILALIHVYTLLSNQWPYA